MNFTSWFLKKSVFVNLVSVGVIIAGLVVALNMQREVFPSVNLDYVLVTTLYVGASPEEVERLVTFPIEQELEGINGIDTYTSTSREGNSAIFITLEEDLKPREKDRIITDIQSAVDRAKLPTEAEDPYVRELILDEPLIEIAFSSDKISELQLRDYVNGFKTQLNDITGVGQINVNGWKDEEIWIEADPKKLEEYEISLGQLISAISSKSINLPGGKFDEGSKEVIIRTIGELSDPKDFGNVIVRNNYENKQVRVKDLASVSRVLDSDERIYKTDGLVSINLTPLKQKDADTIRVVDAIKILVADFQKQHPEIHINLLNDMSFYVKRRLNVLLSNGWMGLVLLLVVLFLFLNFRIALVTAMGIPFAFMMALLMMSFFNISLNMITMFGLILVLGMIVDDAIVISENVYRHMEEGYSPHDATVMGVEEVFQPVLATVTTTMVAFLPLMFVYGIMGKFLKFFPMGVIFCLGASLLEAFFILPNHLAEWVRPIKSKYVLKDEGNSHFFHKYFEVFYKKVIEFSLKFRYKVLIFMFLFLVGSVLFAVKFVPVDLFPEIVEILYVQMEAEDGTSSEGSNQIMSQMEKIVMELPATELKNITTTIGFLGDPGGGPFNKYGSKYAQSVIYLTPETSRERKADLIVNDLRERFKKANIKHIVKLDFEKAKDGPPTGKAIEVAVKGVDFVALQELVDKIKTKIAKIDGVTDIGDDYEFGKDEIVVSVDEEEATKLGLTTFMIAQNIRYAFDGGVATTIRKGTEEIDVKVKLPKKQKKSIQYLKNIRVANSQNRLIRLGDVASFTRTQGVQSMNHKDGKRTIRITANVDNTKITSAQANMKIMPILKEVFAYYPGFSYQLGGEWEDTEKSLKSLLKALLVALFLIYFILATQFDSFFKPIIIMVSIPYGLIGVIYALFLHGEPISLMALFGVIGLTGVIVNDSLILVEFIDKKLTCGVKVSEAIIEAGAVRLRPILLTSITTIIALVPLIYGIGGEEPFVAPACISMAYGLLVATIVTLIVVPCCYRIYLDIKIKIFKRN